MGIVPKQCPQHKQPIPTAPVQRPKPYPFKSNRRQFHSIEREFHAKVSAKVRLMAEGVNRFRVITPFLFEDGDHLVIVLKREGNQWVLTDEAHTFMHLSYDLDVRDLQRGTRQTIISNALTAFGISEDQGELRLAVRDGRSLKSCPPWRMFQDAWDGMIPLAARCRRVR